MAKKPIKVVGKASKSKKPGKIVYSKEGLRYNTNQLPWGVEVVNGVARYRVKGAFATYSKWKDALKKHLSETARERNLQRRRENDALLAQAKAAQEAALKKAEDEKRKADEKEAKRLEKEAKKVKPEKKTYSQEKEEKKVGYYRTSAGGIVDIFEGDKSSLRDRPTTDNDSDRTESYSTGKIKNTKDKPGRDKSQLQKLKISLMEAKGFLADDIDIADQTLTEAIRLNTSKGFITKLETLIRKGNALDFKIETFLKNTTWVGLSFGFKQIENGTLKLINKVTSFGLELGQLVKILNSEAESANNAAALNKEIDRELEEIDKDTQAALDLLKKRKIEDQKNYPNKFKRPRKTINSGFANALGMGFENESKFFGKLFSPFTNYYEDKKEQNLKNKYSEMGISDEDMENNPLFDGIDPKTASIKDYSVKEKIKRNAEKLKKNREKELRRRGIDPSTSSIVNNNVGGSSSTSSTSNFQSTTNNVGGTSIVGGGRSNSSVSNKNSLASVSNLTNSESILSSGETGIDLNRTDDGNPIVEEQEKTNVILGKILKTMENGKSGGGLLGGLLGGGGGDFPSFIPPFWRRKKTPVPSPKGPNSVKGGGSKLGSLGRLAASSSFLMLTNPMDVGEGSDKPYGQTFESFGAGLINRSPDMLSVRSEKIRRELSRIRESKIGTAGSYSNFNSVSDATSTINSKNFSPIKAVDTNQISNIYNSNKGTEVDFSPHEAFMMKSLVPALSKAIASAISGKTQTLGQTQTPGMKLF